MSRLLLSGNDIVIVMCALVSFLIFLLFIADRQIVCAVVLQCLFFLCSFDQWARVFALHSCVVDVSGIASVRVTTMRPLFLIRLVLVW